jgi:DNA-binding transcriptional LysR family regulator
MNWAHIDFDWNQARAFFVTASEGSLSAAARELKQTQPTLSRQVAALEQQLGVTLFERVGRQLVLTETGRDLAEYVRKMADAAGLFSLHASGRSQAVVGEVRITAGVAVSAYLLPPIIERVRQEFPEIRVHLVASNEISDLLRREADIAIRHVRPAQDGLVAKKVRDSTAHLYAAESWIGRCGRPKTLADVSQAVFAGAENNQPFIDLLARYGIAVRAENFQATTDNDVVRWEFIKQGLGIGWMIREIAAVTSGIEQILPELPAIPAPFWVCAHRELHTSRRVRVVYDRLAEALAELP